MTIEEYKKQALQSPKFKKEYERYDLAFEVGQMVLKARILAGLTQKELAQKLGTKQTLKAVSQKRNSFIQTLACGI